MQDDSNVDEIYLTNIRYHPENILYLPPYICQDVADNDSI